MEQKRPFPIPVNYFSIALGLLSLGLAWRSAAYLAVNGGHVDMLAICLIGYGLLNFLFLARLLVWILEKGFAISLWAFSFGLGSMAAVGVRLQVSGGALADLGTVLFWGGTVLIGCLFLCTLRMILQGRFLVK